MGFIISLGIKINFLFYPWSAWSRRGLEFPVWEKTLQTEVHYQGRSQVIVWEMPAPPLTFEITHPCKHISLLSLCEKPEETLLRMSKWAPKKEEGKRRDMLCLPKCHESTVVFWRRREVHGGGRELSELGSYHFRLSTALLLYLYLTLKLDAPNTAWLKTH